MSRMPASVAAFFAGKRIAIAGVSRQPQQAANAIYRKLRDAGFEVFAVNPNATEVEDTRAYPDLVVKFRDCARRVLGPDSVERALALLESVETVGDVDTLVDALVLRAASTAAPPSRRSRLPRSS